MNKINCIIIDDDHRAAEHLKHQISLTGFDVKILDYFNSVKGSISWLSQNKADLIFMDIQLSDGLSFEIFDFIKGVIPVIFTTYDEKYSIKAFDVNSIAYLLKPVGLTSLISAIEKYKLLQGIRMEQIEKQVPYDNSYRKRFLVQSGNSMLPIAVNDVAYFRVHDSRYLLVVTKDKSQYLVSNKLELLEQRLDPEKFFRINRQFIIHIEAINEIKSSDNGKLRIELIYASKEELIVSKEKASSFKNWLER